MHSLQLGDALAVAHTNFADSREVEAVVYTDVSNHIPVKEEADVSQDHICETLLSLACLGPCPT